MTSEFAERLGVTDAEVKSWGSDWRRASEPFVERDFVGRQIPRHQGIEGYLLLVARLDPGRVRSVPARAVLEEGEDDGPYALVACPCEHRPVVTSVLTKCPGCERWYVYVTGGKVFVAYGAMAPPAVTPA